MNKKLAIVTGASRGIGKAVALFLAQQNYHVVLIARTNAQLLIVQKEIEQLGGSASAFDLNIADPITVQSAFDSIISEYGKVDLLFNNAGILKLGTSELSYQDLHAMIEVNLLAAINIASIVAKQMKQQRSGYIINLSSLAGKKGMTIFGGYSASKFGLVGFSDALLQEMLPYNVKVTAICPSYVDTDMPQGVTIEQRQKMIRPEDIARTVSLLLNLSNTTVIKEIVLDCPNELMGTI